VFLGVSAPELAREAVQGGAIVGVGDCIVELIGE
jgi:hypothetical protein